MKHSSEFWVAGHITGIFEIKDDFEDPLKIGSRGAGFCISRGVFTRVNRRKDKKDKITFNRREIPSGEAIVTEYVIREMKDAIEGEGVDIAHKFEIPISNGYGASAAGALGTAFGIDFCFDLGMKPIELYQIAHKAEIKTRCGLGDVLGVYSGGIEIRVKEGAPGIGFTRNIPSNSLLGGFFLTISLGKLSTSKILRDPVWKKRIKTFGALLLKELLNDPTVMKLVDVSRRFGQEVGIASTKVKKLIDLIHDRGIMASQIMLGNGIFIFCREEDNISFLKEYNPVPEEICHETVILVD